MTFTHVTVSTDAWQLSQSEDKELGQGTTVRILNPYVEKKLNPSLREDTHYDRCIMHRHNTCHGIHYPLWVDHHAGLQVLITEVLHGAQVVEE